MMGVFEEDGRVGGGWFDKVTQSTSITYYVTPHHMFHTCTPLVTVLMAWLTNPVVICILLLWTDCYTVWTILHIYTVHTII